MMKLVFTGVLLRNYEKYFQTDNIIDRSYRGHVFASDCCYIFAPCILPRQMRIFILNNKLSFKPLKVNYPNEFTLLYLLLESDLVLVECLVYLKR